MPAVKYAYDYYDKKNKGVAKDARSNSRTANMTAGQKVASNVKRTPTPESTKNSIRKVTSTEITSTKTKNVSTVHSKKNNNEDIDLPTAVQKKNKLEKPEEMKLTKPKPTAEAKAESKAKIVGLKKKILLGFVAIVVLFLICMRYTQINEKFNEVSSLEKELSSIQALNQQLNSNIESKTDLNYIEKYAKYQLGMQKPVESQIVRIAYDKQDKISTPVVIDEEEEESFLEKLFNALKNLID